MTNDDTNQPNDAAGVSYLDTDRRRFLQAAGVGAVGLTALGGYTAAQSSDDNTIELEAVTVELGGGRGRSEYAWEDGEEGIARGPPEAVCGVQGGQQMWMGVSPGSIADVTNPTLDLVEGETYTVEWTNTDGETHNFVIVDGDGGELVSSDDLSEEGESQTVEFEATEAMAEYHCGTHPSSQRGDVDVGEATDGPFEVSSMEPTDTTVSRGDVVDVSVTVTNTSDEEATDTVTMTMDGEEMVSHEETLGGGESTTTTMEMDTSDMAEGAHEITISSGASQVSGTMTVEVDDGVNEVDVLVFSVTDGYRHSIIPFGNEQIQAMEGDIAAETGADEVTIDVIDNEDGNAAEFPSDADDLLEYDTIVWNSTTGSPLNAEQQEAFEEYVTSGGGYAGIHAASDTHYDWEFYGDLVGAYFDGHPDNQEAELHVTDGVHPSTEHMPGRWTLYDEWYDYDHNPRGDVHVLMTLDEDTYDGAGMDDGRVDHPISWCHNVEGGRSWYTGLGHTQEAFENENFLEHVLQGILWSAGFADGEASATVWDAYEPVEVTGDIVEPMSMSIAPDGRIFCIQRTGEVMVTESSANTGVTTAINLDVYYEREDGGLGVTVDPDFEDNGWLYVYYSPAEGDLNPDDDMPYNQLSRFTVDGDTIDPDSEVEILRVHHTRAGGRHSAGELQFGPDGELWLSAGDDIGGSGIDGYAPTYDLEPESDTAQDARGTAGNTADLRGSIMRIVPNEDGSYDIPEGNLKESWEAETGETFSEEVFRPEIFVMGCRNPFRFDVDTETGWLYYADYGPDAEEWSVERGPVGIREYNQVREPANAGWPMVRGPNVPYTDYDWEAEEAVGIYDPENPVNDSPTNDGLEELPPVEESTFYVPRSGLWDVFTDPPEDHPWGDVWDVPDQTPYPEVTDSAPNGGPLIRLGDSRAPTALDDYFDGKWIIAEWSSGNLFAVSFDDDGDLLEIEPFLPTFDVQSPHDLEVGPNGRLFCLDFGGSWSGDDDPGIFRIDAESTQSPVFTTSSDDNVLSPGESTTVTATLANPLDVDLEDVQFSLELDEEGIEIESQGETSLDVLTAGENHSVQWDVSVSEDVDGASYGLGGSVTYVQEGEELVANQTVSLNVATPLELPYAFDAGGEQTDADIEIQDLAFDTLPNVAVTAQPTASPDVTDVPIENTEYETLYQSQHSAENLGYEFVVPNGTYDLRLHFAESGTFEVGGRVFDLDVQGETVIEGLDLYEEAGPLSAHTVVIEDVEVTGQILTVTTESGAGATTFSGIEIRDEIEPLEAGTSVPFGLDLGGTETDSEVEIDGTAFIPVGTDAEDVDVVDPVGGFSTYAVDEDVDIADTDHDALYWSEIGGDGMGMDLHVGEGTYDVTLYAAEIYHEESGNRVFSLDVQGETVLEEFDLVEEVGANAAFTTTVEDVRAPDGVIEIRSETHEDNTKLSGVAVSEGEALELHLPLEGETATNVVTDTDATVTGDPTTGADTPTGTGFEFDGEDDVIVVEEELPLNGEAVTFAMWTRFDSFDEWARLFHAGDGALGADGRPDGGLTMQFDGSTAAFEPMMRAGTNNPVGIFESIEPSTWYFVTCVLQGDFFRMHVYDEDGELDESPLVNSGGRDRSETGTVTLMAGDGRYTTGVMDQFWGYSRALPVTDVQDLYEESLAGDDDDDDDDETEATLEAHLPLDGETATNVVTDTEASHVGDPTTGADGIVDDAFAFDGEDDSVILEEEVPLNGEAVTVTTWLNYESFDEWSRIFQVGLSDGEAVDPSGGGRPTEGFALQWASGDPQLEPRTQETEIEAVSDSLEAGAWYFVAYVIDGDDFRMHVFDEDGELGGSPYTTTDIPARTQTDVATVGLMAGDGRYTEGRMDDFRGYDGALSADEVQAIYEEASGNDDGGGGDFDTVELDAEVTGWIGASPSAIEGETNPTLSLTAGEEYTVRWTNTDTQSHNFYVENGDGEDIVETDLLIGDGTGEVTFTATEEMAEYYCQPHPEAMRGDVEID